VTVSVAAINAARRISSTPSSLNSPFSDHLHQLLHP